ncbi:hypothetical protein DUNSADRAFT_15833 [Dunaliella salina]|uniref:Uncharacterized protein n=1 Tax=Dunaliella salina TaxID=3046 RepID=A0ABQ7G4V0_DUNSA|nr:hypothetical protein DUNSADRAFT_15833 [Dunaliella salina]|eukprot:KAF5829614.1 hypothetical protein DUNSADRAFT_15833 [Dunaliella salina]
MWGIIPWSIRPEVSLILSTSFSSHANCRFDFELGYSIRLGFLLKPIKIPFGPFDNWQFTLGRPLLPFEMSFTILSKRRLPGSWASGCLVYRGGMEERAEWQVSEWGPCSANCGGGVSIRDVTCVRIATGQSTDDFRCPDTRPESSALCNQQDCGAARCPDDCTLDLLLNDVCDQACNVQSCNFDNGKCNDFQAELNACTSFSNCIDCLTSDNSCGWCASSATCAPGTHSGPFYAGACLSGDWDVLKCVDDEPRLLLTAPDSQKFYTGGTCQIKWTGGNEQGQVSLYIRKGNDGDLFHGRGLPENDIPSSPGSFTWNIPNGFSSGTYRIYIFSSTDRTNFAWSHQAFSIVNREVDFYQWQTSSWGPCSQACGFGTKERSVYCINAFTSQEADPGFCNTYTKPSTSQTCNTHGCQDSCPSDSCGCIAQPSYNEGYLCGFQANGFTYGCDTVDTGYQECCRDKGSICDDGCVGKAEWVKKDPKAPCSKECGGGTQKFYFKCEGYWDQATCDDPNVNVNCDEAVTCVDTFCGEDPSDTDFECNTHPCLTYTWSVSEWTACTRECGPEGVQSRSVDCMQEPTDVSDASIVDDDNCGSNKPATQQSCNTNVECWSVPIRLGSPKPGRAFLSGSGVVVIAWEGCRVHSEAALFYAQRVSHSLSGGSDFLGCFEESSCGSVYERAFTFIASSDTMTPSYCIQAALSQGFSFAALQNGNECFGGNDTSAYNITSLACDVTCSGDTAESCGGGCANAIYKAVEGGTHQWQPISTMPARAPLFVGCFEEPDCFGDRPFEKLFEDDYSLTPELCITAAARAGLMYAAVQYGRECAGGNDYTPYIKVPDTECGKACSGDQDIACGGGCRNDIYETGVHLVGCFEEPDWPDCGLTDERPLTFLDSSDDSMTPRYCIQLAAQAGFAYAAVQYGRECFGGDSLAEYVTPSNYCDMPCTGDSQETCGGGCTNRIYATGGDVNKKSIWAIPENMTSGLYRLNATCDDEVLNTIATDGRFSIQSKGLLSITLFPCAASNAFGTASELQVKLLGTHGAAEKITLAILSNSGGKPGTQKALGVMQWEVEALDVGDILEVKLAVPSAKEEACAKSILLSFSRSIYEVGFPEVLPGGSRQEITRRTCEQYSSSCYECSNQEGCGYCHQTRKCMPLYGGDATGPATGWCPESEWASAPDVCKDECTKHRMCSTCMQAEGCGWCSEDCLCKAVNLNDDQPHVGSCSSPNWVPSIPLGERCSDAQQGEECPLSFIAANASASLKYEPNGDPLVLLSAAGSTTCTTCSAINCGENGYCEAFRNEAYCVCVNGWSGLNCETPPSACYGISCQGKGVCVASSKGVGQCVCPPSSEECKQAQTAQELTKVEEPQSVQQSCYSWLVSSVPNEGNVTIAETSAFDTSAKGAWKSGLYKFSLTIVNNAGETASAEVALEVSHPSPPPSPSPPPRK